jgi:hypothetical protein
MTETKNTDIQIESFSVIYSIDGPRRELSLYIPENKPRIWKKTEDSSSEMGPPRWWHKKYGGILTPEQFENFVDTQGLYAEDVETMGSIGAPGYGFGWAPAISFMSENDIYQNAYVTPNINETEGKRLEKIFGKEKMWDAIREYLIGKYGI